MEQGTRGNGLYISSLTGAIRWGEYIVKCELVKGTRILWHSEPDPKIIKYLSREFGRGILSPAFRKILPLNKQLEEQELIVLFHHLVREAYFRTSQKRESREILLGDNFSRIYSQLKLHDFDGICVNWPRSPELVLFNPSRVKVLSIYSWSFRRGIDKRQFWDSPYNEAIILSEPIELEKLKVIQEKG